MNYNLLNDAEMKTTELFKQHVLDFESKHINKEEINGLQYPKELQNIFKD